MALAQSSNASAWTVRTSEELADAARALGLPAPLPTAVLVGGADGMSADQMEDLKPFFREALAPAIETSGAALLDGGTDVGVMRLMGEARAAADASFPLVGVAVAELVKLPGSYANSRAAELEPQHTHFVLVPGEAWGDEAPWLARLAGLIAGDAPSVTILINGGELSWADVAQSVQAHRPVIVAAGSGRTADVLAAALRSNRHFFRARAILDSGLVSAVDVQDRVGVVASITKALAK